MSALVSWTVAFLVAVTTTRMVRRWSRRRGIVDRPGRHKAHREPTPLLGGVAIYVALLAAAAVGAGLGARFDRGAIPVVLGASIVFALGLVDDLRDLAVGPRLLVQLAAAAIPVFAGSLVAGDAPAPWLSISLSLLWIVGVTNAFNLLDNMDGVTAGVGSLTAILVVTLAAATGRPPSLLSLALAGACLGFLRYNFPPASIFMGDSGSLLIGFLLAAEALPSAAGPGGALALAAIFFLPLLDTSLVVVSRLRRGKNPLRTPGRDHLPHRLVRLGLSVRTTVLTLYAVTAVTGVTGLWIARAARAQTLPATAFPVAAALAVAMVLGLERFTAAEDSRP